jgi:hypothetical protein
MTARQYVLAASIVLGLSSASIHAQWLKYPTPGIPRLPDGRANLAAPAPRTADGKPDISGLWRASVNYILDLTRAAKPGDVVMLPETEALVKYRRETFSRDDPSASCIPGGVPRSNLVSAAYPMRIVTAPGRVVILYEAIHGWREIFTDGRTHPPDMNPTWMGYSVGRWVGDDLVVETAGFNDKGWLDNTGHPNTSRLRVTERFRRKDFGHMDIEITIDDRGAYAKPWTVTLPLLFQADTELLEYICNENNRYFEIVPKK